MAKTKARTRRKDRKASKPACVKYVFRDLDDAQDHALDVEERTGERMRAYWCPECLGYHITHAA